jgi:hypothetical protein
MTFIIITSKYNQRQKVSSELKSKTYEATGLPMMQEEAMRFPEADLTSALRDKVIYYFFSSCKSSKSYFEKKSPEKA